MVRVNLISPRCLADQHLLAEHLELLMLVSHARRYPFPKSSPRRFVLGPGHINFFKDKLVYLKRRHDSIRAEMARRGFHSHSKVSLSGFPKSLRKDWRPTARDKALVRKRIISRLKRKPKFYRYCGEHRSLRFFVGLVKR